MAKKQFSAEQIVTLLRQIEVSMAQGKSAPEACRDAGISQQSFYRWRTRPRQHTPLMARKVSRTIR
jgi:putative transposase